MCTAPDVHGGRDAGGWRRAMGTNMVIPIWPLGPSCGHRTGPQSQTLRTHRPIGAGQDCPLNGTMPRGLMILTDLAGVATGFRR